MGSGAGGARGGGGRAGRDRGAGGPGSAGDPTGGSLETFGSRIQGIANDLPESEIFGDKAFISDIKTAFRERFGNISDAEFDNLIIRANRQGSISTARADLVIAINEQFPGKIDASTIRVPSSFGGSGNEVMFIRRS